MEFRAAQQAPTFVGRSGRRKRRGARATFSPTTQWLATRRTTCAADCTGRSKVDSSEAAKTACNGRSSIRSDSTRTPRGRDGRNRIGAWYSFFALTGPRTATSPSPPCKDFPIHPALPRPPGLAFRPTRQSSMPRTDIRISRGPNPRRQRQGGSKSAHSCRRRPPPPRRR
jgi:hypothetical protein